MLSPVNRRVFGKMSALSLMVLNGQLPALAGVASLSEASIGTRPLLSPAYSPRPGEPVFLLEGSTLEDLWAVRRRLNPLLKSARNPVMVKDRDWEGGGPYLYGSVLYDDEDR